MSLRGTLRTLLLFLLFSSTQAHSLVFDRLGGTMAVFGEIEPGDYQKFISTYRSWEVPPRVFSFDSLGGDVLEAIAIANFVRLSRIPVLVTGTCYSSCAFIFLAATNRDATGRIGLHRPYLERSHYSQLNSLDAEREFRLVEQLTKAFLEDMGVEASLIEIIRTTPSDKIRTYSGRGEVTAALGEHSYFLNEWQISKCGSLDSDALGAWCATTWLSYIRLNSVIEEGWKERFLTDPIREYHKKMPGRCRDFSESSQELAMTASRNKDALSALNARSLKIVNRDKCTAKAEDKEVWAFFKIIKESSEGFAVFNKPARTLVLQKYELR